MRLRKHLRSLKDWPMLLADFVLSPIPALCSPLPSLLCMYCLLSPLSSLLSSFTPSFSDLLLYGPGHACHFYLYKLFLCPVFFIYIYICNVI